MVLEGQEVSALFALYVWKMPHKSANGIGRWETTEKRENGEEACQREIISSFRSAYRENVKWL